VLAAKELGRRAWKGKKGARGKEDSEKGIRKKVLAPRRPCRADSREPVGKVGEGSRKKLTLCGSRRKKISARKGEMTSSIKIRGGSGKVGGSQAGGGNLPLIE